MQSVNGNKDIHLALTDIYSTVDSHETIIQYDAFE